MWPWIEYLDCVVVIFSACLIAATIRLHFASEKLYRLRAALAYLEMYQQGDIIWWRQRALEAEGELRRLKEKDR